MPAGISSVGGQFESCRSEIMHPSESNVLPSGGSGNVCIANPFPGRLRFQSSVPHLKRFIMFDQSGGRGRIFFHPALVQELFHPTPYASSPPERSGRSTDKKSPNLRPDKKSPNPEKSGEPPSPVTTDLSEADAKLMAYRETVASAFATLQSLRSSRLSNLVAPSVKDQLPHAYVASQSPSSSRVSCGVASKRSSGAISSSLHENSEDLDALMNSDEDEDDDVRSTGHSPGELSPNESYSSDCDDAQSSKKRRVSSGKEGRNGAYLSSDVSFLASTDLGPNNRSSTATRGQAASLRREFPSRKWEDDDNNEVSSRGEDLQQRLPSFASGLSSPGRKARKQKIKRTVKTLRSIIPGGDCLDAAVVLDEAIHYVKALRDKVHELEASRLQQH